jgi:hypothetical protein
MTTFAVTVSEFSTLLSLHLLAHGLKVSLHAIDVNGDAAMSRERLRMFREDRGKHT